jgi:hypothetical protein
MVPDPELPDLELPEPELLGDEPVRRPRRRDEFERAEPSRHHSRWLWWGLALVIVVGAGGAYADGRVRAHEATAVGACEQRLREASALSDTRMGLLATYVRPARRTTLGVQQLHLADLMAERAQRVLRGAQRADRICRRVSIRPWHFSLVARRDAATAYSGTLVTLLQAVAAQGRASFHDASTLTRLRAAAGVD